MCTSRCLVAWLKALFIALLAGSGVARADDRLGLQRGANPREVSLSGVSSGAAMATQYAVAHSGSVSGVGAIAGPPWGCAEGRVSRAVNACMCGKEPLTPKLAAARELASRGAIDSLPSSTPQMLDRAYVFQSAADKTVVKAAGDANIAFLAAFIGKPPQVDRGNAGDGSDHAGHGIVSPDGSDSCKVDGKEKTYVRQCGAADNAGALFHSLYPDVAFDASKRVDPIPDSEIWRFDQKQLIEAVKATGPKVTWDTWSFWFYSSARRQDFDMADTGYLYVPPSCRQAGSSCRVHVALHGCKQDAQTFAATAGYNNWAEHYKVIVVYPAVAPGIPVTESCETTLSPYTDYFWVKANPNGCWDWWGYLDPVNEKNRYLTKAAPQMLVIERIIAAITAPQ